MLKIVLDTSIFVNPDSRFLFGKTPKEALTNFLDALNTTKKHITCYIPPSVYEELTAFVEKLPPLETMILLNKKPPSSYQTCVPALLVYEFIEEMRLRINKGLRIAEKYARKGLAGAKVNEEEMIQTLRQEYRTALREGVIDSKQDFDLVLLAKELNAHLATSDGGLITWAQKLGITCMSAQELKEVMHDSHQH